VARQGKLQREAKSGGGGRARRVGRFCKQEVAGLALHGGGRHCTAAAASRAGKQAVGGRIWTNLQFPKILGTQM